MHENDYILSYGLLGDFGRFRAPQPLACRRGDRMVVRTPRGVEIAQVLRETLAGHAKFLPNRTVGPILRLATSEDEAQARRLRKRGRALVERGNALGRSLGMPLEILDAEFLLENKFAAVHLLRWGEDDLRPLVGALSVEFAVQVQLVDLGGETEEPHDLGCGREGCGEGGGGCGSCGDSGSCSSCGSAPASKAHDHAEELPSAAAYRHALL